MAGLKRGGLKISGHTNIKTGAHVPKTPSPSGPATAGLIPPSGRTGRGKAGPNLGQSPKGT